MVINSLTIYNFRNLLHQSIQLFPEVNFLVGQNGHGKTNFIEAIYCLSRGKSFRTSKLKEIVNKENEEASVFAKIISADISTTIGLSIKNGEKQYYLNHENVKSIRDILGKIVCITFTPNDLALVKGGPSERRSFIDKHVMDSRSSFVEPILTYQRALKHKNLLLKNNIRSENELLPWNRIMAEAGYEIYNERRNFIQQLEPKVEKYYRRFSNESTEIKLSLSETRHATENYKSHEEMFEALNKLASNEIKLRSTIAGPHRQELSINIDNKNSRMFSSQGEARSMVLALKLSALEIIEENINESPITLLDDVDSELDAHRREALMEMIFSKGRQVIVTATHIRANELDQIGKYAVFDVSNGSIREK